MTPSQRRRFEELRGARKANRTERSKLARWTERLVRDAAKSGESKTRIAEVAGISRQTVHQILREEK